jgi:methyl-accepting chemotaxis protein
LTGVEWGVNVMTIVRKIMLGFWAITVVLVAEGCLYVWGHTLIGESVRPLIIAIGSVAAVGSLCLSLLLPRSISRQLKGVVADLGGATDRVRSIASQVASGAVQTATAISEAATTVDEVRQTSLLASQKSTALSDRAEEAEVVAESGRQAVSEIVEGMQDIHGQMNLVSETVVQLSEQAQAAEEIIASTNQVAEQSNLLSVNAALEAAKAKEHGKGFGVVADEMRNLAAQSKKAVKQIRTILADIQKATGEAVLAAEKSGKAIELSVARAQGSSEAIESLADSVEMSAQSSKQIASSSQQQLAGMDQISEAMESIDSAGAQNAQAAQQMEVEVGRLKGVSAGLLGMIDSGGDANESVAEARRPRRLRVPSLSRRRKKAAGRVDDADSR